MKYFISLFVLVPLLFSCSSDDDNPNNNPPSGFSANTIAITITGATIEWTDAIDLDDDVVTYSIYLEDQLISTGGTTTSYNFTGLDPETNYDGYVEATDGNGGISIANFFFTTEPQVITIDLTASYWEYSNVSESGGRRIVYGAGFQVPFYEAATLYQIEIHNYAIDGSTVNSLTDEIFTWTNESQSSSAVSFVEATGKYGVVFNSASVNSIGSQFESILASMQSANGTATVSIMIGN